MKKILFGIFAHPDDEAFGPSASLYLAAQSGIDVHLVLVTDGEKGSNPDNIKNLGEARLNEWQKSSSLIGATSSEALHYPDGKLCTDNYLAIAAEITEFLHMTIHKYKYKEPIEVDIMTFDYQGISGHLDHIAVSMITTYVYLELCQDANVTAKMNQLKYYCLSETMSPRANTSWVYMPAGKHHDHIDETITYENIANKKLEIMKSHHSQRFDCASILARQSELSDQDRYCDHFHYYK